MNASREPLTDTDPEAAQVHLALLRRAEPGRRLWLALSWSHAVIALSRQASRAGRTGAVVSGADAELTVALRFVELHYGAELAAGVRARLEARPWNGHPGTR